MLSRHPHILTLALAAFLPLSGTLAETTGFYIETINRGSPAPGVEPIEETSKTYIANDKMIVVNDGADATDLILDPAAGIITFVNHAEKQYLPIDVQAVKTSMSGPASEQMRAMLGEITTKVEPTDETRRIGEWNTRKYLVSKSGMMQVEQEIWATEDVDLDASRYTDMMSLTGPGGMLANTPAGIAQRDEMAKIKGYPILTKTKMEMMGTSMETETEVRIIRQESMEDSRFEIPEGYTLRKMGSSIPMPDGGQP
ncbi:MAG: DUF4412 domain-containing protein [Sphingobacteriia bacterium]|nr:DUF4412 domain-containing protein [Sphingobacteriia bacterium]NCC40786.1 DUF4412 domain-containing protein [Gammaproteobacteria bacterium]